MVAGKAALKMLHQQLDVKPLMLRKTLLLLLACSGTLFIVFSIAALAMRCRIRPQCCPKRSDNGSVKHLLKDDSSESGSDVVS